MHESGNRHISLTELTLSTPGRLSRWVEKHKAAIDKVHESANMTLRKNRNISYSQRLGHGLSAQNELISIHGSVCKCKITLNTTIDRIKHVISTISQNTQNNIRFLELTVNVKFEVDFSTPKLSFDDVTQFGGMDEVPWRAILGNAVPGQRIVVRNVTDNAGNVLTMNCVVYRKETHEFLEIFTNYVQLVITAT